MTHLLLPGVLEQQGAAGGFNPETDITWHSFYWAEGSSMSGYSDTDSVSTWYDDGPSGHDGTLVGTATFDAVTAAINNQPSITYGGGRHDVTFTSDAPTYPNTLVVLGAVASDSYSVLVADNGSSTILLRRQTTRWQWYCGYSIVSAVSEVDTDPHLFCAYSEGDWPDANDWLEVDGTQKASGDVSLNQWGTSGMTIGNSDGDTSSTTDAQYLMMVAIYEGDFTADGSYSDFCTWAEGHYGLTIA